MTQFPFNLWTTNIDISAQFLTFSFFLPNFSAQVGNIGQHHPCTQLLKKSAAHTHKKKKKKRWIEKQVKPQPSPSAPSALSLKQKWEAPHAWRWQCFQNFYWRQPRVNTVQISIYIYIHELVTETSSHPLSHGLFLYCLALENSEANKTRHCGGFLVTNG